jgi:hypothetical protein
MIPGWLTIGSGTIEEKVEGATTGSHDVAFSTGPGPQGGNTLRQQFRAVPGGIYRLVFDAGIFGRPNNTLQLRAQVFGGASLVNQLVTPPVANTYDPLAVTIPALPVRLHGR